MPFKPSSDPRQWQELYSEQQAFSDSANKESRLSIATVIALMIPVLYIVFWSFDQFDKGMMWHPLRLPLMIVGYSCGMLLLFGIGRYCIQRAAVEFIRRFHDLPGDENLARVVNLRVAGIPRLPPPFNKWISFPKVTVEKSTLNPPDHWSTIIGGPAKLEIKPGHALYLERFGRFSRVVGQGSAFLDWEERIAAVIDVGPKTEEFSIEAWTMDGIKIEVQARGEYFLGRERNELDENILIPFDPESVKKAVEHTYKNGRDANDWIKSATGQTQGILGGFISRHYLDQLFLRDSHDATLLSNGNITDLVNEINQRSREYGVSLSNLQILNVKVPRKVDELRKKTFEAAYESTVTVTQGEVKAHEIRTRERARAEMQRNLILTIAHRLNRDDSSRFPEHMMLFISGFLDQGMSDPAVRANLGKEALEILEKLQETMKFPLHLPGNEE